MDHVYFDIMRPIYKWDLFSAITANGPARIRLEGRNKYGLLQSVEREDGSGHNFNLTYTDDANAQHTIFRFTAD